MIALGNDHSGLELKAAIKTLLDDRALDYHDYGTFTTDGCDYPIYAKLVTNAVVSGEAQRGILICGTGIGMSIAANKVRGIRCALCTDVYSAELTRRHNNSNVLALGARITPPELALKIVEVWLNTPFDDEANPNGRHARRVKMLEE